MERESNIYYANVDKILNINSYEFYSLMELIKDDNRIIICLPDRVSPGLYSRCVQIYYPELRIGYGTEHEITYHMLTQLIYVNSKHLNSKLFHYYSYQRKIDFADVLVVTDKNLENYHNLTTISFLLYADHKRIDIPKIIFDFAMKINEKNDNVLGGSYKQHQTSLVYGCKENMFSKINHIIGHERFSNLIIHVPDHLIAKRVFINISSTFPNLLLIIVDNYSTSELLKQIVTEKLKIIIAVDIEVLPLTNVDIVIDLMRKVSKNIAVEIEGTLDNYTFIDKKSADHHINYINANKCYRFIGKNNYVKLKDIPLLKLGFSTKFLDKYFHLIAIDFCQNNIDPNIALNHALNRGKYETNYFINLQDKIKNDLDDIFNLRLIDKIGDRLIITTTGIFVKTVSLNYRYSYFLYERIFTELPVYPAIVLATFLHFHRKFEREYLLECLNSWNNLIEYLGNFHEYFIINYHIISNKNLILRWAKDNNNSFVYLDKQFRKINKIYLSIKNNYRIKNMAIKPFESNKILQDAKIID